MGMAATLGFAVAAVLWFALWGQGSEEPHPSTSPTDVETTPESPELEVATAKSPESTLPDIAASEPELRERVTPNGPRGRVVERSSLVPVPDVVVRLCRGSTTLTETTTDADGTFVLPPSERGRPTVELVSERWRASSNRIRLDEDQRAGRKELEFQVERVRAAPVHGRLIDRQTGEGIPEFLLVWSGPGERRTESVTTDDTGRFETRGGFESGSLEILPLDLPSGAARAESSFSKNDALEHEHHFSGDGPAEALELGLAIGPTYRLELALPEGVQLDGMHAAFPRRSKGLRGLHRMAAEDPGSPVGLFLGAVSDPQILEEQAPLRAGPPIWVRFRSPVFPEEGARVGEGLQLHVRSDDGLWSGSAPVDSVVGIQPGTLRIELRARGAISGRVVDAEGAPVPSAWIQRLEPDSQGDPLEEFGAGKDGGFRFAWLEPGTHELRAESDRYGEWRQPVEVRAGETAHVDVVLTSDRPLGTVGGRLRSRTGRHRSKGAVVHLASTTDSELFFFRTISYRELEGEFVAPFEFEKIPAGEYELRINPLDNRRWDALRRIVVPPAQGIEFTCLDDAPSFELEFRAVDARSGTVIEDLSTIVWHGAPVDELRLDKHWETKRYLGVPEDSALTWVTRAEGYAPMWGDASAIFGRGDLRVIVVRLEPGWGQIYKVTTRERDPLEGVELFANGEHIGVSDAQGLIAIQLPERPKTLEFRLDGWRVTWGRVDTTASDFGQGLETPVYMQRE